MPSIQVGAAPVLVVDRNAARKSFSVRNASTAGQIIYIDNVVPGGMTIGNAGHPLSVGESLNFLVFLDGPDIRGPWSAIASAGAATLYYKEYSERRGD